MNAPCSSPGSRLSLDRFPDSNCPPDFPNKIVRTHGVRTHVQTDDTTPRDETASIVPFDESIGKVISTRGALEWLPNPAGKMLLLSMPTYMIESN
jgi:hypothetical protein